MSFLKMQGLVMSGKEGKRRSVERCIDMCYDGSLQPTPEQIAWAVEITPKALYEPWETKHRLIRLCTALLTCNHLSKEQVESVEAAATDSVKGDWETANDCAAYIDAKNQGISANYVYNLVFDSRGAQGQYEYNQGKASVESVESQVKASIKLSLECGGQAYGGKAGAETSLEAVENSAKEDTKIQKVKQSFNFDATDGHGALYEKVVKVRKGGKTVQFFVALERFKEGLQQGKQYNNRQ